MDFSAPKVRYNHDLLINYVVFNFSFLNAKEYLTIILRGRAGYRMIDNQRGA